MGSTLLPHEKPILEYQETLDKVRGQHEKNPDLLSTKEIAKLEKKLEKLKEGIYSKLTAWERVLICRHPERPHAIDYIEGLCSQFVEIHGDRTFKDDPAVITGFGYIDNEPVVIIGQEKGKDTQDRIYRNFGMSHPEGYRKALRAMKLAEKFSLPVVSFLDTLGAYPGLTAEERGQGWAIATNLFEMAGLKTPMIVIVIGEGCSGGALGVGMGDTIGMLEHSYYSVISPEGCASILWKDASKSALAASKLKMHAEDLISLDIVDEMIKEPQGGAHHDKARALENVKEFIMRHLALLKTVPVDTLLDQRYAKFRRMGKHLSDAGI